MNKYLKIGLILSGIGVVIALAIFYWAFNKPHRDISSEKADFQIEAAALFSDFQMDEAAANAKYNDKVVEVSGTIFGVNPSDQGITMILEGEMEGVSCMMDSLYSAKNSQRILGLASGETIRVKGRCVGLDLIQGVIVDHAVIVE